MPTFKLLLWLKLLLLLCKLLPPSHLLTCSSVNIKATTWTQECKDLFDYESQHIVEKNLEASASTSLFRVNDDIQIETSPSHNAENPTNIVYLKKDQGNTPFFPFTPNFSLPLFNFFLTLPIDSFSVCRASQTMEDSTSSSQSDNLWLVVKSVNPSNVHYVNFSISALRFNFWI